MVQGREMAGRFDVYSREALGEGGGRGLKLTERGLKG